MIEQSWQLKARDGALIYGTLNKTRDEAQDRAIVFVHGMTCTPNTHPIPLAVLDALKNGYDVIRFAVHSEHRGARNSHDVTVDHFAEDFLSVCEEFSKKYKTLFAVGHSYGGTGIAIANSPHIKAASLWDPTYDLADNSWANDLAEALGEKEYKLFWNNTYIFDKNKEKVASKYDIEKCRELSKNLKHPVQIFLTENYKPAFPDESFHTHCAHAVEYHRMPEANHFFDNLIHAQEVVQKTTAWFNRF